MINLSYSRISLSDIAQKLQLDSPEDAEFIVAKASIFTILQVSWCFADGATKQHNIYNIITIVSRGDWLGKPTNIKVENNSAVVHVGSSLTVHNALFFYSQIVSE